MKSRGTKVRSKIFALLVSLFALWAFAAYVTVQAGLNLLWINSLDKGVGRPTDTLVTALQAERRLSTQYLGSARSDPRVDLDAARHATDTAMAALKVSAASGSVRWAADATFEQRIDTLLASLDSLPSYRVRVDTGGASDRAGAAAGYTTIIDSAFRMYDDLGQYANEIADGGRTVVTLSRAREILSQEDAMMSGILRAQSYGDGESNAFTSIVAVQHAFYADAVSRLSTADRAGYDAVVQGPAYRHFLDLETQAVRLGRPQTAPPFEPNEWRSAIDPVLSQLRQVENDLADVVLARATPAAIGILIRLALAGGLGLIAVIASIVVAVTTTRRLVRQLERLRTAAEELASFRLPRIVERLQHGERVDVEAESPPLDFGRDEIGRVGQAFNAVHSTAIQTAVDQAELRRSVRDVFLSLARRSQALLHRQLGLLDVMERRANDPDELAELFRVDHLATRMRRNAENLIVLSGASAGRAWRRPVPMIDVVRGALAEVEDYTRVTVTAVGGASLVGRAVGDVIHLLAELIENAVSFSPPQSVVRISGTIVGNGFAVEIEDRGLGMSEAELTSANAQLRNPPEFKLSSTARLGLYVVAKLAERHGIKVQLSDSAFGGTTAVVVLPATLIADDAVDGPPGGAHRLDAGDLDGFRPSQLAVIGAGRRTDGRGGDGRGEGRRGDGRPADRPAGETGETGATAAPTPRTPPRTPPPDQPAVTPSGLPWRQRPATPHSAPTLADVAPLGPSGDEEARRQGMRDQLSALRSATRRARTDAARMTQPELDAPEWTDSGPAEGDSMGRTDG